MVITCHEMTASYIQQNINQLHVALTLQVPVQHLCAEEVCSFYAGVFPKRLKDTLVLELWLYPFLLCLSEPMISSMEIGLFMSRYSAKL